MSSISNVVPRGNSSSGPRVSSTAVNAGDRADSCADARAVAGARGDSADARADRGALDYRCPRRWFCPCHPESLPSLSVDSSPPVPALVGTALKFTV